MRQRRNKQQKHLQISDGQNQVLEAQLMDSKLYKKKLLKLY